MALSNLFTVIGNTVGVASINKDSTFDVLPKDVYTLSNSRERGFHLTIKESFFREEKLYGDVNNKVAKVIKSFNAQNTSLGVMLTGYKGSGKTMFTRELAKHINLPVIIIDTDYSEASGFEDFMNKLGSCVIIFDEFGKIYKENAQEKMLSFFDGTSNVKRLIIITENNLGNISFYLKDRPSRFKYHFKFTSLDEDIIKEFCVDHNAKEVYKELIPYIEGSEISFDTLNTIINEYALFKEPVENVIKDLNISLKRNIKVEPIKVFYRNTAINSFKFINIISSTDSDYDNNITMSFIPSAKKSLKTSDIDNINTLLFLQGYGNTYNNADEHIRDMVTTGFDDNDIIIVGDYAIIVLSNNSILIAKLIEIPKDAIIVDKKYLSIVEELIK